MQWRRHRGVTTTVVGRNPSHSFVAMRLPRREVRSKSAVNTSFFEGITVGMQCAIGVWNGGPSTKRHIGRGVMALAR